MARKRTKRGQAKPPTIPGKDAKACTPTNLPPKEKAKPPTIPSSGNGAKIIDLEDRKDPRSGGAKYFLDDYVPHDDGDPLRDRVRGSVLWSAYGDACGMPWEGQAPFQIYKRNGGWVEGLRSPKNNFSRYLSAGGWTDDTQLKIAIMESIIEHGNVNMDDIGRHHVRMLDLGPRGWGGSTRESVLRIKRGGSWRNSGKPGGAGNGIAMKCSPIGILYGLRYREDLLKGEFRYKNLANDARNLAVMTHRDSRAVISGIVHSILVAWALNGIDPIGRWDDLMNLIRRLEGIFPDEYDLLSERFEHIPGNLERRDVEYFAHLYRTGCFVVESYPFSVACYLLHRNDVVGGVLAAVNAGGDCDSTGAIVGDLCGAEAGLGTEDRTLELEEHDLLLGLVDAFYDAVLAPLR